MIMKKTVYARGLGGGFIVLRFFSLICLVYQVILQVYYPVSCCFSYCMVIIISFAGGIQWIFTIIVCAFSVCSALMALFVSVLLIYFRINNKTIFSFFFFDGLRNFVFVRAFVLWQIFLNIVSCRNWVKRKKNRNAKWTFTHIYVVSSIYQLYYILIIVDIIIVFFLCVYTTIRACYFLIFVLFIKIKFINIVNMVFFLCHRTKKKLS